MINPVFAGETDITSGSWIGKGYAIAGGWKIINRNDKNIIVFDENFRTRNGPDLKVFLSKKTVDNVNQSTLNQRGVKLGPLIANKGAQEYEIPTELILQDFSSILIHCEQYSHLWGGGDMSF